MYYSPLRYPGGKGKLTNLMELLIDKSERRGGTYIEPFAGGAGVALELLDKDVVTQIVINDLDKGIYSFWRAIIEETDRFIEQVATVPLTIDEWNLQRNVCINNSKRYSFELGFATFYMNRTNRSGIIKGGVIGGKAQSGLWKLDARFNREELINRIERVALKKKNIHLYNKDINSFIVKYAPKYEDNAFIYFDPPYYGKGKQLYMNFFDINDHIRIEKLIRQYVKCDWAITYDDAPEIVELYKNYNIGRYDLSYSAATRRTASELIVFNSEQIIPTCAELENKQIHINLR